MYKRRIESTSSSSSSDNDSDDDCLQFSVCRGGMANHNSRSGHLSAVNGSRKKARNDIAEQREQSPVTSTSSQFQAGNGIIVKEEIEEKDSMAGRQSQPEVERSRRKRVLSKIQRISKDPKQPSSSKKISAPKPYEKYFEGCLVMGRLSYDRQRWPGIIRKPGADDKNRDYSRKRGGKISLFVQFFTDPTGFGWREPWELTVFGAAKPNRCKYLDPVIVVKFEKAVRIATAAANFSVEARLRKFTLPNGAEIDNLLAKIDLNINNAATEVLVPKPHEKYFEGCLVMGFTGCYGYPYWPGIIRKAGAEDDQHPDYIKYDCGRIWYRVQYFKEPTTLRWVIPRDLGVFDAVKRNRCEYRNPAVIAKFEKAIRIATAAANVSVNARLEMFTLLKGASIDGLLAEIDVNSDHITTAEPRSRQDGTPAENTDSFATTTQRNAGTSTDSVAQNGFTHPTNGNGESCPDSVAQNGSTHPTNGNGESCPDSVAQNRSTHPTNGNGESCPDSVAQNGFTHPTNGNGESCPDSVAQNGFTHPTNWNGESCPDSVAQNGSTHPTNGNGESCPDSFEAMIEERISEHQKLREEWNREKDEEIRSLTRNTAKLAEENNQLTQILKQQAISIAELQEKQEKEKQEHRKVLENEKQKWKTEVENEKQKWKIEVEKEKLELKKEVEKEKQEKLKYKQESEKRKAILEKSFPALKSTTQT